MSNEDPDELPVELIVTPITPLEEFDRMTMTFHLYHEHLGDDTKERSVVVYRSLETKDVESYTRRATSKPDWSNLDLGWIEPEQCGLILVENLAGKDIRIQPTEEEKEKYKSSILEIGNDEVSMLVHPGWPVHFTPRDVNNWKIRSLNGESFKYRITVYPK